MKPFFVIFAFLAILGCNSGSSSHKLADENENGSQSPTNSSLKAFIQSGPFQGHQVLHDIVNSQLKVSVPIGVNSLIPTGSWNLGQVSGQITSGPNGFKSAQLSIPLSLVSHGVTSDRVGTLPNGESLASYFNGAAEVDHTQINLGQSAVHLYFHSSRFGVFVQTPFDQGVSRQYPVYLENSFVVTGSFSTHLAGSGQNGGLFLLISLPQ